MNNRFAITRPNFPVLLVLVSIIIIGIIGIPFGDPRFVIYAILIELLYISLAALIAKGYAKALYACIFLSVLIIVGNSFVTAHIHRIMTFSRPLNTLVLIIGGYVLQGLLAYTSIAAIRKHNRSKSVLTNI
ncbi:MAG TPA: hypothetical protein VE619_11300 [Nitrososphaeraceae archaeon]|nr:hypothetical protein [Nitrososphaeraceae archaeon]